jgi:hypothetical protein
MTPPTQAELIAQMATANAEMAKQLDGRVPAPQKNWWEDWLKPQVVITMFGFIVMAVVFWQSVSAHHSDKDIMHHTYQALDERYVQVKIRDQQDRLLAVQLDTLNKHLDAIEEQLRRRTP